MCGGGAESGGGGTATPVAERLAVAVVARAISARAAATEGGSKWHVRVCRGKEGRVSGQRSGYED